MLSDSAKKAKREVFACTRACKMVISADSLLLLDGATGHTLKQRGLSDSFADAALANLRRPELVTSVHREERPPPPSPLLLNPSHRTRALTNGAPRPLFSRSLYPRVLTCSRPTRL